MKGLTSLIYNGTVKVKRITKTADPLNPKIIKETTVELKNKGTTELFKALVQFLLGNASSTSAIPKSLYIIERGSEAEPPDEESDIIPVINGKLFLNSKEEIRNNNYYAVFSTFLSKSRLTNENVSDTPLNVWFILYSDSVQGKRLAYVAYDNFPKSDIIGGQDLLIEWRLGFENDPTSTGTGGTN